MKATDATAQPSPRRRNRGGCLIGCAVAAVLTGVLLATAVFVLPIAGVFRPGWFGPFGRLLNAEPILKSQFGIELRDLNGVDPGRFDPWSYYPQAQDFAGADTRLVKVRLTGVRSDGTLDLKATYTPAPRAEYTFQRKLDQSPPNAPPVGAGGSVTGEWYEPVVVEVYRPGQRRSITRTSGVGRTSIQYTNRGAQKETREPVARGETTTTAPGCALATLWQEAITRGTPAEAVATVEYSADGYRFTIAGTAINLEFGADCRVRGR